MTRDWRMIYPCAARAAPFPTFEFQDGRVIGIGILRRDWTAAAIRSCRDLPREASCPAGFQGNYITFIGRYPIAAFVLGFIQGRIGAVQEFMGGFTQQVSCDTD